MWDDLSQKMRGDRWTLGDTLDVPALTSAIEKLDSEKIDVFEFHRQIRLAGVIFCHVYFHLRQIYYMGQDGNYYLEKYFR